MKFAQIIEFRTSRIDEFDDYLDAWMTRTEGDRIPHRAVAEPGTETPTTNTCSWWSSHRTTQGMENSNRPETAEFAIVLAEICEEPLTFRNLDVLREEDL